MAVLPDVDRITVWTKLMRDLSDIRESIAVTKTDLRAAINAVDDWCDTNAASFNTAIPQPARAQLTASQKALLLAYVALRRAGR